jgi:hypothetical protein
MEHQLIQEESLTGYNQSKQQELTRNKSNFNRRDAEAQRISHY